MTSKSLFPWKRGAQVSRPDREEAFPFLSLRREIDRLFEDFNLPGAGERTFAPRIDVEEREKEIVVSAELPGVEEKDVQVSASSDFLTIRGEKKEKKEEKRKNYYRKETFQGIFDRRIPLPCEVDRDKAAAVFRKGVLTVTLPKSAEARADAKTISVGKG